MPAYLCKPLSISVVYRICVHWKHIIVFCGDLAFCIVLYCIVLYCIVLYCIVLCCVVLCCVVLCCAVLCCVVLCCVVLCCVVLYSIVLYCIMRPYTDGPIGPLSYRHSSGVVRNPHSALAEWEIFKLRSISPQGTHLLIARRRNSITSVLASISWMTCLSATCEPRTINLSISGERITFTM